MMVETGLWYGAKRTKYVPPTASRRVTKVDAPDPRPGRQDDNICLKVSQFVNSRRAGELRHLEIVFK